ncbi:MAG: DMT family transporter [Aquificae bacterium]|nr:DMT family transporter [Aquificota bacterium]
MKYNHALGAFFSLLSAFFWATNDIFNKKLIQSGYDENFVLWVRFPLGTLLLLPLGIAFWEPTRELFLTTLLWLPGEILGSLFFIKALKYAPLSLAMPFFATMPLFSALAGWVLLGETLDLGGFLGILFIAYGSALLAGRNPADFFRANRGALYALASSFLFGVNVALGKLSVLGSNQFFFAWYYCAVMSVALLPFIRRFPRPSELVRKEFLFVGLFFSLGMLFYSWAYLYTYASYVAALERLSIALDVLYGRLIFHERVKGAFRATALMLLGALLLTLR